jgi:hypothetical protein
MADKYYELQDDVKSKFNEIARTLAFPVKISFKLIGDIKQKKLITVKRIPDAYAFVSGFQVLVSINEPLFDKLSEDEKTIEVLFIDELNNITVNVESGMVKIGKPNFVTNTSVAEKYTFDEVKRVKELERLAMEHTKDSEKAKEVDVNSTF